MSFAQLNESPIHVIDALREFITAGDFDDNDAVIYLCLVPFMKALESFDYSMIDNISIEAGIPTYKKCLKYRQKLRIATINDFIANYNQENQVKLLNDLTLIERMLLKLYKEAGVEVHNDI